jgi:DNA ligase-1
MLSDIMDTESSDVVSLVGFNQSVDFVRDPSWEGVMYHNPWSYYHLGLNYDLLKDKPRYDYEGKVVCVLAGEGKNSGKMGSLVVEVTWDEKVKSFYRTPGDSEGLVGRTVTFKVGGGFSNEAREKEWKLGTVIRFSFTELSRFGKPPTANFEEVMSE